VDGLDRERELEALVELARELARHGVKFGMSDARPALSIRGSLVRPKVWVQVDTSRESFVWRRDDHEHHAIDDPAGAAVRLVEYLKKRDAGPDETS
jgi:hypothetical protein